MPQHKPVVTLLDWSLKSVECLVKNLVLDTSDQIINQRNLVNLGVVFYVFDVELHHKIRGIMAMAIAMRQYYQVNSIP